MLEPLISVIIPVYNTDRYLDRCLYSIAKQSYTNLEIIIIDDGATDHSAEIIDKFAKKDNRVKHYHNTNMGVSLARGYGLKMATGSLIAFLDSDDFLDSDCYLTLVRNLIGSNSDISVCGYYKYIESAHKGIAPKHDNKITTMNKDEALEKLYTSEIESYIWNKLYKKELLEGIDFPNNTTHEDIYIMYKIFNKAKKIVYQDTPKYYFVQRDESITHDNSDKVAADYLSALTSRYKSVRDEVDVEVRKKMLANIYSVYVEQNTKDNKEDALLFVKNLLLLENLDFRPYLDSLKRKQLYLRKMGIGYHKQYKIINILRKKEL